MRVIATKQLRRSSSISGLRSPFCLLWNGFVERLQGTILQEHWRVAFRRRYFTSRPALQRSLEAFMQSYNHERPHQGDRVRGRTLATLFWGAARG